MPQDPLVSLRGDRAKLPLVLRAAGRYFITGAALRGGGDNATMFHHATVDYRARPYVKLTRRKWERLARRHAAWIVPTWLLGAAPWIGIWPYAGYETSLATAGATYAGVRTYKAVKHGKLNRTYVDPAAATLFRTLGHRYAKRTARTNVILPNGWTPGEPARLVLPSDKAMTEAQKKNLVRAVGGRLGITDATGSWLAAGPIVTVDIAGTPLPPKELTYADLQAAIEAAPISRPVVGMGPDGPVDIDYDQDSPHVAASGPSGTGKSTLLRTIMAQRMHHGAGVIMLDYKRWSHRWLHDLPEDRCRYVYKIADIHEAAVAIGVELDRRINCEPDELGTFREVDVYVEEINSLIKLLNNYWRGLRKETIAEAKAARDDDADYDPADLDPPLLSPAVAALQFGVNMGRELQIHFHVAAQRLEANVFGSNSGAAVRESFQLRFMAKWDRALWKMLASGHEYVAWPGGQRGLWGFVQGQDFKIVRVLNMDTADAVRLATSGHVQGPILGGHGQRVVDSTAVDTDNLTASDVQPAIVQAVRLADAVHVLPKNKSGAWLSLEGLRTASKRPGFPASVGQDGQAKLYDLSELIYWREGVLQLES